MSVVCCRNRSMNLAAWAERNGVARVTAYRWFRAGVLPVPARRVGRLILVGDPIGEAGLAGRTAGYARVSCADQKADLDPWVHRIVVEHWDRFCRFGSEYVVAALAAQGRELVVVDAADVDDDLVRDMTEILTSMWARLYGKRAGKNRAKRALAAAAAAGERGAA